ncbi:MAG: hypothetical protein ACFCUV_00235, partial [Rivularia sp. (in: cyanobacteria)]
MYSNNEHDSVDGLCEEKKLKYAATNIYYCGIIQFVASFVWTKTDKAASSLLGLGLIYLIVKEPLLIS